MARKAVENREQDILSAAIKIFSEKGFNAATTSEIAKEAGIAEGTLFRYFKNKKDLLNKVLITYSKAITDELIVKQVGDLLKENKDRPPKEILRILLLNRIELIEKNLDVYRIIFTEMQYQEDIKKEIVTTFAYAGKNVLSKFIEAGILSEQFRQVNVVIAVRSLIGMLGIYFIQSRLSPELIRLSREEQVEQIIDLFLHGIAK